MSVGLLKQYNSLLKLWYMNPYVKHQRHGTHDEYCINTFLDVNPLLQSISPTKLIFLAEHLDIKLSQTWMKEPGPEILGNESFGIFRKARVGLICLP